MNMRELIPGRTHMTVGRGETGVRRNEEIDPILTLHREMNRLFDGFRSSFHDSDVAPFGFDRATAWPSVEVAKTDKEIKVTAELPGLYQKDVRVELANNILVIDGEKEE